jgi:hypothetical protein
MGNKLAVHTRSAFRDFMSLQLVVPIVLLLASRCGMGATGPVLTRLELPAYPPLANQARVGGDVEIQVGIRQDGSVESATVISGHALLTPAALESAMRSQFRCDRCSDAITLFSVVYTFVPGEYLRCGCTEGHPDSQLRQESREQVTQSDNHVSVAGRLLALCPDGCTSTGPPKIRAARCLFLWRCHTRLVYVQ